ncbi:unnamed protein product [Rotaria sordida]|uniref:Uncharacterized protein n=1 Tax=Rotaria sordida TaxID=392033 RepID=A0A813W1B2_9BILA|nr:unnamed protein product [Rotaria sordida]CAF3533039.1 unnamed protein product [Rotaria sordida]
MSYSIIIIASVLLFGTINQIDCLQCYRCSCSIVPGETTCTDDSELQCVIEYVENNYCIISRLSNQIRFGHNPNSDLIFLESLHYIRDEQEIIFLESSSTWQLSTIVEFSYGCDWNLCNTPRLLSLLPHSLTYTIDSSLLTNTLIAKPNEPFTTCLSCTKCANSTNEVTCPKVTCNGTCFINGYSDDPLLNSVSCLFPFESVCREEKRNTSVHIKGTYYIDDDIFGINDIDIWCKKTDCNSPTNAQIIQQNINYSIELNDQIYFRPNPSSTTPSTPNNELLACYKCHCEHEISNNNCNLLECTIEYENGSYCEIVRDFQSFSNMELINIGHVQRRYVPYRHYIHAEEEIILYRNLSWHPPSVRMITYVCDWELCNDPRIVDRLTTSFQFNAEPSVIAGHLQSSESLSNCRQCTLCTNSSIDFDTCPSVSCSTPGHCYIHQYLDNPEYNDCEYAFQAECETFVSESSIIIIATYNIDDDILNIDEVGIHCSKNDCNKPQTVYDILNLMEEDIQLDSLFFIRPIVNTTAGPTITEPLPSSTVSSSSSRTAMQATTESFICIMVTSNFATIYFFLISSIFLIFHY